MPNELTYKAHGLKVRAQMEKITRLRIEDKLTYQQIAQRFGVSENFIKSLFREARSQ